MTQFHTRFRHPPTGDPTKADLQVTLSRQVIEGYDLNKQTYGTIFHNIIPIETLTSSPTDLLTQASHYEQALHYEARFIPQSKDFLSLHLRDDYTSPL